MIVRTPLPAIRFSVARKPHLSWAGSLQHQRGIIYQRQCELAKWYLKWDRDHSRENFSFKYLRLIIDHGGGGVRRIQRHGGRPDRLASAIRVERRGGVL